MLYLAWKHTGADPRTLYNGADAQAAPRWPARVRSLIYAFAETAQQEEHEFKQAMIGKAGQ